MSLSLNRILGTPGFAAMVGPPKRPSVLAAGVESAVRGSIVDRVELSSRFVGVGGSADTASPRQVAASRLDRLTLASSFGGYRARG
jgi:hypothetical protein